MQLKSEIAQPRVYQTLAGNRVCTVRGAAWAGQSDVTEIAVSTDGGQSWAAAEFLDPVQQYAWRRWKFDWLTPKQPGKYTLLARAKDAKIFGAGQYAMRMWVKPDQLAKLGITVTDITNAIQAQNTVNPAGQAGGEPAPKGQEYTYAVRAQGRLESSEEFGQIVVRETQNGGIVRVKDVARVELGRRTIARSAA
jgi:hypothetical protein